jgi:hypothetical protein
MHMQKGLPSPGGQFEEIPFDALSARKTQVAPVHFTQSL